MPFDAFYSDPHFGHANIIRYAERPFADVREMDAELIRRYNAVVAPDQCVLWVGDCFFHGRARAGEIMSQLNGRKVLVRGNHDSSVSAMLSLGFELVVEELVTQIQGVRVRASHYPHTADVARDEAREAKLRDRRPPKVPGEVLVHGHTHGRERVRPGLVHVGVDAWDYRPARYKEVSRLVREATTLMTLESGAGDESSSLP